ncbi:hypothetical protein SAMN02745116_02070 [Pilibacter termitis]|uniref:Uncharacterized protein n=1 Tax=Pilibacter termitis TaxID=263852 RepID=A0A1T4Q5Z8_9ENTE|nr:hypothetical protein SAMN02745116_02070 [Pilibacter termitis]
MEFLEVPFKKVRVRNGRVGVNEWCGSLFAMPPEAVLQAGKWQGSLRQTPYRPARFSLSSYEVQRSGGCSQHRSKLSFRVNKRCGSLPQTSTRTSPLFYV